MKTRNAFLFQIKSNKNRLSIFDSNVFRLLRAWLYFPRRKKEWWWWCLTFFVIYFRQLMIIIGIDWTVEIVTWHRLRHRSETKRTSRWAEEFSILLFLNSEKSKEMLCLKDLRREKKCERMSNTHLSKKSEELIKI